jgi:hypothetical protein
MSLGSGSPLLTGRCSRQWRKSCAVAKHSFLVMQYVHSPKLLGIEIVCHCSPGISNARPDKEVSNKTLRPITKLRGTVFVTRAYRMTEH